MGLWWLPARRAHLLTKSRPTIPLSLSSVLCASMHARWSVPQAWSHNTGGPEGAGTGPTPATAPMYLHLRRFVISILRKPHRAVNCSVSDCGLVISDARSFFLYDDSDPFPAPLCAISRALHTGLLSRVRDAE